MTGRAELFRTRASAALQAINRRHRRVFVPVFLALMVVAALLHRDVRVVVALALLAAGALIDPKLGERPAYAHGLPGVPDGPPAPTKVPPMTQLWVSSAVALIGMVLVVLDASWWAFLALVVFAGLGLLVAADSAVRYVWHTRRLRRALRAHAPTIAMGFAGRSGAPWQLRMWEPYLLRSGERCVVINLHEKYVPMILADAHLSSPFIQLGSRGTSELASLLVPSLTSVYYVQNAKRNQEFMAHKRLTHVWLNHGDSDKPANFNPRHALYDILVVCGQAGIDRYARHGVHVDPDKFAVLGRPQAAGVELARGPIADRDPQVVLYAPTWQGLDDAVNFSSLEKGPDIVRALLARGCTVIFRPHPLSYRWRIRRAVVQQIHAILAADREETGRQHVWGAQADKVWNVVDCTNHADALISDVSSVVSDFLQSEKPYAMTSMRASVEDFRAEFSVAETGYVLLGDLSNLDQVLDEMLGADPLAAARSERKRYVLGEFVGEESAEAFARFVRDLAGRDV